MEKEKHYMCPICGGISDEPGVCKKDGCDRKDMPLKECHCGNAEEHKKSASKGGCDCGDPGCAGCK